MLHCRNTTFTKLEILTEIILDSYDLFYKTTTPSSHAIYMVVRMTLGFFIVEVLLYNVMLVEQYKMAVKDDKDSVSE